MQAALTAYSAAVTCGCWYSYTSCITGDHSIHVTIVSGLEDSYSLLSHTLFHSEYQKGSLRYLRTYCRGSNDTGFLQFHAH